MKHLNKLLMTSIAPIALTVPSMVHAQDAQADATADNGDIIIVTGVAGGASIRKQDAAYAITSIDEETIDLFSPKSTADMLKLVPGISVESSGGQNGANIFVRGFPSGGDARFVTFEYEGSAAFVPPTLSFLENSQLFRIDETVQQIEAVRGGPSQVFSSGQVGLTANIITKKGGDELEGLIKLGITDFGDKRIDGVISGPLGDNTTFSAGGFYHSGEGIRSADFNIEEGGQFSANIAHNFGDGEILVYARYLNDSGAWLLPIPVNQSADGGISEFAGFDIGTGTFNGNETRLIRRNDGTTANQADGRGANIVHFGANISYDVSDTISLFSKTSYLEGDADTTGLVPASAPVTLNAFAAGLGSTVGTATFVSDGATVDPTQQVLQVGAWTVNKQIESFSTENGVQFDFGANKLTIGTYFAAYSSSDQWNLGNGLLVQAVSNPRVIDLTLADGRVATRNGTTFGSFFNVNANYDGQDVAIYVSDEFEISDKLRVDAGIRWQEHQINGANENNSSVNLDGDPNTLFDNGDAVLNGTFTTFDFNRRKFSWTVGANYAVTDDLGFFARYSRGNSFPQFDDLRDGLPQIQIVDTFELGAKVSSYSFDLFATAFYNDFSGLSNSQILNGQIIANTGAARTYGLELEANVRPADGLSIGGNLTYLNARYTDFFVNNTIDASGNDVQRQPEFSARGNAAYTADLGFGEVTAYGSVNWIDDRFSDILNQQVLPSYTKVDAGIVMKIADSWQFQVSADNLFDSNGITEGNPRVLGTQGTGPILARPILGRSFNFSAQFKF